MSYEQAIDLIGDAPAWVLQSIIERQPRSTRYARAALLLLKTKKQDTDR